MLLSFQTLWIGGPLPGRVPRPAGVRELEEHAAWGHGAYGIVCASSELPGPSSMSAQSQPVRAKAGGGRSGAGEAAATERSYTISALAQEFALTTRAIRFYEDEGLIAPRRRGRVRVYGERERVRIKLVLRGKRLGLSLSEIRELFDLYATTRNERPQLAKFLQMLADRRGMLLQQREDIDAVLAEIAILERDCRRRLKAGEPEAGSKPSESPA